MAAPGINAIQIEKAAMDLLDRYGIEEPKFDIEDLAFAEGYRVERGGLQNIDAWLIRQKQGGGVIRLRSDTPEDGRTRFSIAHELGHADRHPNLSQGFLCSASDMTDYVNSHEEIEANLFAVNLLMPRLWIPEEIWRRDADFKVVSDLASSFGTTLTAAARRYVELNTKRAVALIFAKGSTVQWSIRNEDRGRYLYVPNGSEVPKHSLTQECTDSQKNVGSESIDPATWFPNYRWSRDSELFEDVRYSKTYSCTLTLLWVPEFE